MRSFGRGTKLVTVAIVATLVLSAYIAIETKDDAEAIIIFTGDVHCAYSENLGYDGVSAYKLDMEKKCNNVMLVDTGDFLQGDVVGLVEKGKYMTDFMDLVGYDIVTLGNHEFDNGADYLWSLLQKYNFETICCNLTYTGEKENPIDFIQPYTVRELGNVKIGFIGVISPQTYTSTSPANLMEDGEIVYDFQESDEGRELYETVQNSIDRCKALGATQVVLLSHLGDSSNPPYTSVDVAKNTDGLTCILDGHQHSVIKEMKVKDKCGHNVSISSTGTKLNNIGCLKIMKDGSISVDLVNTKDYTNKDPTVTVYKDLVSAKMNEYFGKKAFVLPIDLPNKDSNGVRAVRNQETALGNMAADSFRIQNSTDVAFVNGGSLRDSLYKGDITYYDALKVMAFINSTSVVEVSGQTILDALEMSCSKLTKETSSDGQAMGESGGFLSVSGLKFDVDTSIGSPVILDDKGSYAGMKEDAQKRVSNVKILDSKTGEYADIDVDKKYTVAGNNFILLQYGDGYSMFKDSRVILPENTLISVAFVNYAKSLTQEQIKELYSTTDGRITRIG